MLLIGYILAVVVMFIIGLATVPSTGFIAALFGLILMGPLALVNWEED